MGVTKQDVHRLQEEVSRLKAELQRERAKQPVEKRVEVEKIVRRHTPEQEAENAALRAENDRLKRELQAK